MTDYKKHYTDGLRRKIKLGGTAAIVVGAVLLHRARVRTLLAGVTLAYNEGVDEAFDNGVKYGIQLLKDAGLAQAVAPIAASA